MPDLIRLGRDRRLELRNRVLAHRAASLFRELDENEELQRAFIESPSDVIGHDILGRSYTSEQASAVNKFLFSILANDDLRRWSEEYDRENAGRELTPEKRLADLAQAFVRFGDASLMTGLLEIAATGAEVPGFSQAVAIIKAESVAVGNWFVYKVSGRVFGHDRVVLPAARVQQIAEQLIGRARQLRSQGLI